MNTFIKQYDAMIRHCKNNVYKAIYHKIQPLSMEAWITKEPVSFLEKTVGNHKVFKKGDTWGDLWDCAWFHFSAMVPEAEQNKNLVLLINISGEACIYDEAGCPMQGLTNVNSSFEAGLGRPGKRMVRLAPDTKVIDLWADCGCNDLFGNYSDKAEIIDADIAVMDEDMYNLFYDMEILIDLMQILPKNSARYQRIFSALSKAAVLMQTCNTEHAKEAAALLKPEFSKKGGDHSLEISAIGHSHIDLAWLWPIRETKRKVLRTFSTVMKNMELYPDYIYGSSQPQMFEWVKESSPALYQKIRERVKEGRFELQGGMWVEPDTNLSGGEALVRQILYGKQFFQSEFGVDVKTLWLPDVFGYSAALPQILKKSGIDYFMTIKLSWNTVNRFPYHTFLWQGIDGSKVLAHMPPEGTYNSSGMPRAAHSAETQYLDLDVAEHALMLYGIGDGGGGPGEDHLESMKRIRDLNGLPMVVEEPSLNFFHKLEANKEAYQVWAGELYLEIHQGTYTSQANNKKMNRLLEQTLCEAEVALTLANFLSSFSYPYEALLVIWKEVLLYQFHDILPGSSITRVYTESRERYQKLYDETLNLLRTAVESLPDSKDCADSFIGCVLNSLPFAVTDYRKDKNVWYQTIAKPMGLTKISSVPFLAVGLLSSNDTCLENNVIKLNFLEDGRLASVFDKEMQKEVLDKPSNQLLIYDEIGGDNWDFSPLMRMAGGNAPTLTGFTYEADGPYVSRTNHYRYQNSTLDQVIRICQDSKRIDFITRVDWQEKKKQLRTSFAVTVFTDHVNCNIQFGNLKRSNHNNTSFERAQYEIYAHKYVDLSQADYGVSLLNNCKYGHYVKENVMDLHLIRNNTHPDPQMDLGLHEFTYSLYPHKNAFEQSDVVQESYKQNREVHFFPFSKETNSLCTINSDQIMIESVKLAEDKSSYIIRMYECYGGNVQVLLTANVKYKEAFLCDLMEQEEIKCDLNTLIAFLPYEIITVKLKI